jgi:hypothetical protein
MIEVIYCMRRKEGLSLEQFLDYWGGVHAPIVTQNLQTLRLAGYERIVPLRTPFSERVERRNSMQAPYDGIARLRWASEDDMRHSFEDEQALAVQRQLARDEAAFVDTANSCRWVARTERHL